MASTPISHSCHLNSTSTTASFREGGILHSGEHTPHRGRSSRRITLSLTQIKKKHSKRQGPQRGIQSLGWQKNVSKRCQSRRTGGRKRKWSSNRKNRSPSKSKMNPRNQNRMAKKKVQSNPLMMSRATMGRRKGRTRTSPSLHSC